MLLRRAMSTATAVVRRTGAPREHILTFRPADGGKGDDDPHASITLQIYDDAGFADVVRTFTPPSARGMGLAGKVAAEMVTFARAEGLKLLPTCSYIRDGFVPKHPEVADLIVALDPAESA
eukprot:TRINITY_DN7941_c0_g1_i1.p1 TRINITY_DN7941_c0_g1~~TRINITY_DN7941_c0_g1_i1.p1  ORF type:complete len:121 (+),score=47.53 TRINITY_DN7941_c0_g1_i1:111-473(+)